MYPWHRSAYRRLPSGQPPADSGQSQLPIQDEETFRLARAFGVPVLLDSDLRDGSLRGAAAERNIPILLYEAGEALRFDEVSIRPAVQGIQNVMRTLGMLPSRRARRRDVSEPFLSPAPAAGFGLRKAAFSAAWCRSGRTSTTTRYSV